MSIRVAQLFDVFGDYIPSKTSLFLKRYGFNSANYLDITDGFALDAANFLNINQATNKIVFEDSLSGYTNSGYLRVKDFLGSTWASVSYPVSTREEGKFYCNFRHYSPSGSFRISLIIDNVLVKSIDFSTPSSSWAWSSFSFVLPDVLPHVFSLRLEENGLVLDKLYFSKEEASVVDDGPSLNVSSFFTLHFRIFECLEYVPTNPLDIYEFKTSINDLQNDDWYNFYIRFLDEGSEVTFNGTYALVLNSSGSSSQNYMLWDLVENDEYAAQPSALMVKND